MTPLHLAVRNQPDAIPLLLEAGADVNAKNDEGRTSLDIGTHKARLILNKYIDKQTEEPVESECT